jgi:hypothetical protein
MAAAGSATTGPGARAKITNPDVTTGQTGYGRLGLARMRAVTRSGAAAMTFGSRRCRYASSPGGRPTESHIPVIAKRGES